MIYLDRIRMQFYKQMIENQYHKEHIANKVVDVL